MSRVKGLQVFVDAPLFPRSPVFMELEGLSHMAVIYRQVRLKGFEHDLYGPQQEPPGDLDWGWDLGTDNIELPPEEMCKRWFTLSEARLVHIHEIEESDTKCYTGRARGPRMQKVPIGA
eukprot:7468341-Pyramimonas_sp.AAC.1